MKADENNGRFNRKEMEEFHNRGFTFSQIAGIMGCSEQTVRKHFADLGVENNIERKRGYKNWDELAFVKMYDRKMNDREIAEVLNMASQTVQKYRSELGFRANHYRRTREEIEADKAKEEIMMKEEREQLAIHRIQPLKPFHDPTVPTYEQFEVTKESVFEPMSKEDWDQQRLDDLKEWIIVNALDQVVVDVKFLEEYQELKEAIDDRRNR